MKNVAKRGAEAIKRVAPRITKETRNGRGCILNLTKKTGLSFRSLKRLSHQYTLNPRQWIKNLGIMRKAKQKGIKIKYGIWAEAGKDTMYANPFMKNTALFEEYLHVRHFMSKGFPTVSRGNNLKAFKELSEFKIWKYSHEVHVKRNLLRSKLPNIDKMLLKRTMEEYQKKLNKAFEELKFWED